MVSTQHISAEDRVRQLEGELAEMTVALARAWDQLVPFLQSVPQQVASSRDAMTILETIMTAVDADTGAVYLAPRDGETAEWVMLPANAVEPSLLEKHLRPSDDTTTVAQIRNMPGWTGKLIDWLFVPIVVGARTMGAIGVGLFQGRRDFSASDARILTRMTERAAAQIAAADLVESQAREQQLAHEMKIAGLIQRSIQPSDEPAIWPLAVAAHWQPAQNVGGDAWGWVLQPSGKLALFILDVAGKGLPAALGAVSLHTALKMALRMDLSPAEALRKVNEEFYSAYTHADLLATASVIRFDPQTRNIEHSNAGHPPTLIRKGATWLEWRSSVPPLGILPDLVPELQSIILIPGDLVICYSDGYSEIDTGAGLWGPNGIQQAIAGRISEPHETIRAIQEAAAVYDTQSIADDQTVFAIGIEE